jgi:L-asparaginase / beta-aspartyl-peptidase
VRNIGKIALAIHGGANAGSDYLNDNIPLYKNGMEAALTAGYNVLFQGRSAIDAVHAAVMAMEDNAIFNAGLGSALNEKGEVQMEAAIMEGKYLYSGAATLINQVKNPVSLAKAIMEDSRQVMLGGQAAGEYAARHGMMSLHKDYFITDRQLNVFLQSQNEITYRLPVNGKKKAYGTVGAVALDHFGNTAAATSTGGALLKQSGRIGDSCIIGAGCYANNKTCAVSGTGDSEYLIRYVLAHDISCIMEYTGKTLQEACDYKIHDKHRDTGAEMGVVSVDSLGNIAFSFNTNCMVRASISNQQALFVGVCK